MDFITLTGEHFLLALGLVFAVGFLLGAVYEGQYHAKEDKEMDYSATYKSRHSDSKKD